MKPLKLIALDAEDLEIISAALQDAVARVGDIAWLPKEKRFVVMVNRFAWETADDGTRTKSFERRRAALHFDRVGAVRKRKLRQDLPDAVVNILAVRFAAGDAPAGAIDIICSSDVRIRLEVECIEARLTDLGPAWSTAARPEHALEETGGSA